jgi:predicted transcriptional regulator
MQDMAANNLAKVLGSAIRITLLGLLPADGATASEMSRVTGWSVPSMTRNLRALERSGILAARSSGCRIVYRPAVKRIEIILNV